MSGKKSINENSIELSNDLKKCKTCKEYKETSNFYKDKYTKDGFTSSCIICRKEKWKKWYSENTEKARQIGRDGYYKNHEKNKLNSKNYKSQNTDKVREYSREYLKRYNQLEYVKLRNIARGKTRREKFRNISDGTVNLDSIRKLLESQDNKCVHCGINLEGLISINGNSGKHLDHIMPLSKGGLHTISNVQWLCWKCNLKKGDRWTG